MYNFVRIMGRKDASLKINLGVPFKTNERASKPTSERASERVGGGSFGI